MSPQVLSLGIGALTEADSYICSENNTLECCQRMPCHGYVSDLGGRSYECEYNTVVVVPWRPGYEKPNIKTHENAYDDKYLENS